MSWKIQTGARLHFGLLNQGHGSGRLFGGLGAMIDRPGFQIIARSENTNSLHCPQEWRERFQRTVEMLRPHGPAIPLSIQLTEAPPAHSGFGSGTQLALALGRLLAYCDPNGEQFPAQAPSANGFDPVGCARLTSRGLRSSVGIHGFQVGGLIFEAGHFKEGDVSPLISRCGIPATWRFVLVRPIGQAGVSGTQEVQAFQKLQPMSDHQTDRLCSLAVRSIIPAALEQNHPRFANGLWEYGCLVGEIFAPIQGGVFAHPQMADLANQLLANGYSGITQTSWGPSISIVCDSDESANSLVDLIPRLTDATSCDITVAAPLNRGVGVEVF